MGGSPALNLPRAMWLTLIAVMALIPLAMAAPPTVDKLKPGRQATGSIQPASSATSTKQDFEKSPMPVDWQLDQLRSMIQGLQAEVAELRQQTMQHASAGSNVAGRLAAIEQAVQVTGQKLRLVSPGTVEIAAQGAISIAAGSTIDLSATIANIHAPQHWVHGIARSTQVHTEVVVAQTYTPGAGNIW